MKTRLIKLLVLVVFYGCSAAVGLVPQSADVIKSGKVYPSRGKDCTLEKYDSYNKEEMVSIALIQSYKSSEEESIKEIKEISCELGADGYTIEMVNKKVISGKTIAARAIKKK